MRFSLKFDPKGPIDNISALVQIMAWHRSGDKPLSETMMVSLLTHIYVTQPQGVNEPHTTWLLNKMMLLGYNDLILFEDIHVLLASNVVVWRFAKYELCERYSVDLTFNYNLSLREIPGVSWNNAQDDWLVNRIVIVVLWIPVYLLWVDRRMKCNRWFCARLR